MISRTKLRQLIGATQRFFIVAESPESEYHVPVHMKWNGCTYYDEKVIDLARKKHEIWNHKRLERRAHLLRRNRGAVAIQERNPDKTHCEIDIECCTWQVCECINCDRQEMGRKRDLHFEAKALQYLENNGQSNIND